MPVHADKNWIYAGKLRTIRTLGGHHRVLEEDIEKHLRLKLAAATRKKLPFGAQGISESNLLSGRILEVQVDGLMAQVTIPAANHQLTSLIPADSAAALGLRAGDDIITLIKSLEVMILTD